MSTTPSAQINYVSVEHNILKKRIKGMAIHIGFMIRGLEGQTVELNAHFFSGQGVPLKATDHNYMTEEGHVAIREGFVPPYQETAYPDFYLFMPYNALSLSPGKHDLMFRVAILHKDYSVANQLVSSEWYRFRYTK